MNELTDQLAAGMAELGVKKGDRVGIFMPNTPQFVLTFFAILKAGGVVVSVNPLYKPKEIIHQVNDAGIEVMFVMSNFYKRNKRSSAKYENQENRCHQYKRIFPTYHWQSCSVLPKRKKWVSGLS